MNRHRCQRCSGGRYPRSTAGFPPAVRRNPRHGHDRHRAHVRERTHRRIHDLPACAQAAARWGFPYYLS